jgi:hypothetical protein
MRKKEKDRFHEHIPVEAPRHAVAGDAGPGGPDDGTTACDGAPPRRAQAVTMTATGNAPKGDNGHTGEPAGEPRSPGLARMPHPHGA